MWIRASSRSTCNCFEVAAVGWGEVHALARLQRAAGAAGRELNLNWRPAILEPIHETPTTCLDDWTDEAVLGNDPNRTD